MISKHKLSFEGISDKVWKNLDKKLKYDPIWEDESAKLKKACGFCPATKKNFEIIVDIFEN